MHEKINDLYDKIKDLKTKKEFEQEIKKIQQKNDDLFDKRTAALIIVDKHGRNTESISKINELKNKKEKTIIGRINRIQNQREYTKKNGSIGQVANLEIEDNSGKCNLVLWNDDCNLLKNKEIKKGTYVKVINGYVKDGFNGLEINIGRYGKIEIIEKNKDFNIDIPIKNENTIDGKIIKINTTRSFFKDNGEYGFVTDLRLQTKKGIKKITIWDEKVKEIQKFKIGSNIKLKDADIKNVNGTDEIHVNGRCTIEKN